MASDYTESRSADYTDSPDTLWNIPAGWKARETYRLEATGELVEVFELAEPGKEFTVYSETRLRRVSP